MTRDDPLDLPPAARLPATDLPDPLEARDGSPIESAAAWHEKRREELRRLFRHYVYGYAPEPPELDIAVDQTDSVLGGRAKLTEAQVQFAGVPENAISMLVSVFTPVGESAVPVFLGLNRAGNHATVDDNTPMVTETARKYGTSERGSRASTWCVEKLIDRGYGFATVHHADLDPDSDDLDDSIRGYYQDELPGPPGTEWGTLGAWAWGLQRAVDVLGSVDAADEERVAVIGHSRRGKAALLAGATDERIALVVPHQSGTGGCTLSRGNDQETVARINETFPHWFNDIFPSFGGRADRLPVDQHLLISLVAPRPLLDTEGARDYWANPGLALDALRAAAPVYDLLETEGMVGSGLLHDDDPLTPETAGSLLQYRREAEHVLDEGYWNPILDFADCHLKG